MLQSRRLLRRFLSLPAERATPSCPRSPPTLTTLTVLFDGACPLCRNEIGIYRGLKARAPVSFSDISDASVSLPAGTTRAQLLSRFHVCEPDGKLLSGAEAFLALWERMPGWRWLAFLGRAPGAAWAMERAYVSFLRFRPTIQRWVKERLE